MTALLALLAAFTLLAANGFDATGVSARVLDLPAPVLGAACAPDMPAARALCAVAGATDGTILLSRQLLGDTPLLANVIAHEITHLRGADKSEWGAYVAGCRASWTPFPCEAIATGAIPR